MGNRREVLTFGEVLLRYSTDPGERVRDAHRFHVHVAGSELNVAASLAHLGQRVRMVTALPASPLGALARRKIASYGVVLAGDMAAPGRMGTYYYEPGVPPRPAVVTYDRDGSAFSRYPWTRFDWSKAVAPAGVLFTTGITAALSPEAAGGIRAAMEAAHQAGILIAFDVNYRSKLWPASEARRVLLPLLERVQYLFTSWDDAVDVLGAPGDSPETLLEWLARQFSLRCATMVYNPPDADPAVRWRAAAWCEGRYVFHDETAPVQTVDRVGAGDAYAAGFLWALLETGDVREGVRLGSAMMALKCTYRGDVCLADPDDVRRLANGITGGVSR
ncbi:MAG: sugar kinase [Firmicutes bacterium]|nr:sugar kinase [Bacillota bacterium]